jgi:hypothetical protein
MELMAEPQLKLVRQVAQLQPRQSLIWFQYQKVAPLEVSDYVVHTMQTEFQEFTWIRVHRL